MGGGREKEPNGNAMATTTENGGNKQIDKKSDVNNTDNKVDTSSDDVIVPPDGGWGWMVVLGSFLIHVIADGIVYSFGIFYIEFLDYYKGGKGETAWVGSLVPGVTLSVGPFASILTNKYGCRTTTIVGAVIASAGFALSLAAPNLYFLYFSFGMMSGLGFGLIYLPAIVSVGYYFEEKRAFATGLAVCGSGLGAFIFNPFSKYLIDEFGWRGAILIEAGLILNCVLCGALFRPLTNTKRKGGSVGSNSEEASKQSKQNRQNNHTHSQLLKDNIELELLIENKTGDSKQSNGYSKKEGGQLPPTNHIMSHMELSEKPASKVPALFASDGALHRKTAKHRPVSPLASGDGRPVGVRRLLSEDHPHYYDKNHLVPGGSLYQSGSLLNISTHRSHPALYIASLASIPGAGAEDDKRICCCRVSADLFYTLKQMCDFSLLKDPIFLMFVISNFFTSIGFNMPFIFLTDRALDEGIDPERAKWLVSAIGISNTIGRVVFGFLADRKGVNRLFLYNTALTICGIATALCPLCSTYPLLVIYACVFGLFIGVYVSLTSVVLVDLLGLEMLTNSFGLLLLFQGIATLIGPPIAGWLYDATGSYDTSFIVAGVIVATSGVMLYFIPCVRRFFKHRNANRENTVSA